MSGKGDKPRPLSVPRDEFDRAWDRVFGKPRDGQTDEVHSRES